MMLLPPCSHWGRCVHGGVLSDLLPRIVFFHRANNVPYVVLFSLICWLQTLTLFVLEQILFTGINRRENGIRLKRYSLISCRSTSTLKKRGVTKLKSTHQLSRVFLNLHFQFEKYSIRTQSLSDRGTHRKEGWAASTLPCYSKLLQKRG